MKSIHLHLAEMHARFILLPQLPGYQIINLSASPLAGVDIYRAPLPVATLMMFVGLYEREASTGNNEGADCRPLGPFELLFQDGTA